MTIIAERVVTLLLLAIAVVHLLPVAGVAGVERLQGLYGVEIADRNLEILMRHRAVLFGILGAFIGYAAFRPALQPAAMLLAFVNIVSFLYLACSAGGFNAQVRMVVTVDAVAAVLVVAAAATYAMILVRAA